MTYSIISRTLVLITALFLVTSIQVSAQDDFSDGEVLNVPDFAEQPVNTVENVNGFGQPSLTTIFASNNGLSGPDVGIFFDIENVSPLLITILSWDINVDCNSGPTTTISVYMRNGTSQGFEDTMTGWTLVGTDTSVTCAGENLPTPLSAGVFEILPGVTTGIAMVIEPDGDSWNYTDGNGLNQVYNNDLLEIRSGSSYRQVFEPGGFLFSPRVWNGTVYYDIGDIVPRPIPTLSEWGLIVMAGVLGLVGFMAIRRRKVTA